MFNHDNIEKKVRNWYSLTNVLKIFILGFIVAGILDLLAPQLSPVYFSTLMWVFVVYIGYVVISKVLSSIKDKDKGGSL
ncbi:hypothetical protein [Erysipelothrix aquatica]|uniref:hypothetical protein n=1 Tax=Erysipelothrix aquatica TaxID=2683714 RepID=UPI001356C652|nr:hypothetical protein [Erysipelothrix aquatica]